jgi:hypothetical protein
VLHKERKIKRKSCHTIINNSIFKKSKFLPVGELSKKWDFYVLCFHGAVKKNNSYMDSSKIIIFFLDFYWDEKNFRKTFRIIYTSRQFYYLYP